MTKLKALTLAQFGTKLLDLLNEMESFRKRIEAEKGTAYDEDEYATMLFGKLDGYKQEDFQFEIRSEKKEWSKGNRTIPQIIEALKSSYTDLINQDKWGSIDSSHEQIIALTSKIEYLQGRAKSSNGGGRGGDSNGGREGDTNKDRRSGKYPDWRIKFVGNRTKDPETGRDMVWCKHHKSADGVVDGVYFPYPHNHEKWELKKKKWITEKKLNQAKRKKEKAQEAAASKGGDDTKSKKPKGEPKLALSKSLRTALCTDFCISEKEADAFVSKIGASSDDQDPPQSKD